MKRACLDDNPKIVKRIFNWDGYHVEFSLCQKHCRDPDFQDFVAEYPLEVVSN